MLKIIAGEFRSRQLSSPEDVSTSRPYSGRVKESVFNLLRGWFEGSTVLDLFAGVGTVGLEAVSRGAARAYMIERDREIFQILQQNIEALGCQDRTVAIHGDALGPAAIARVSPPVDLIFVDPPYNMMEHEHSRSRVIDMIARLRPLMGERGFVILRSPLGPAEADLSIAGFAGPEVHRYGQEMKVLLYAPGATDQDSGSA